MGKIETPDSATRGILNVSRRTLLKGAGGLALGIFFAPLMRGMDALAAGGPLEPNAFVRIDLDGTVTVLAKHRKWARAATPAWPPCSPKSWMPTGTRYASKARRPM